MPANTGTGMPVLRTPILSNLIHINVNITHENQGRHSYSLPFAIKSREGLRLGVVGERDLEKFLVLDIGPAFTTMAAITDDTIVVGIKDLDFETRTVAVHLPKMSHKNLEDTLLLISIINTTFSTKSDDDPDATLVESNLSTVINWDSELTGIARPCTLLVRCTPRSPGSVPARPASIKGFQGNYRDKHGYQAHEMNKVNIFDNFDKENQPPSANLLHKFKNEQF